MSLPRGAILRPTVSPRRWPGARIRTVLMVGGVHAEVLLVYRRVLTGRWRCAGDSAGTVIRIGTLQFSGSAALLTIPPLLPRMFLGRAVTYSISCLLVFRDMLIQIKQALPHRMMATLLSSVH